MTLSYSHRPARRGIAAVALLLGGLLGSSAGCAGAPGAPYSQTTHDLQSFNEISHGRYLATVGDCTACHTAAGGKLFAGGKPIETPFGTLVSPNITPDRQTGIGAWSDDEFVNAVQNGIAPGGAHLYPAMPYTYFTRMSRNDVLAIRAYLDSVAPVRNAVDVNKLPFPFEIRASMIGWNWLFFSPGEFNPTQGKSAEWNRGAYLVQGAGHCGACHTAKNFLGGDDSSRALQGGVLQGWYSPNVTGDPRRGLGGWSVDDVVRYLKTGHNAQAAATGPMAEVITDSTSHLDDADLRAMASYLKDQPSDKTASKHVTADNPAMKTGRAIYVDNCSACHASAGTGVANLFPPLKNSPIVQSKDPTTLLRIVLHGTRSVATDAAPTAPAMPAMDWKLSDAQIAAVLTYIRNAWGNEASAVSADAAQKERAQKIAAAPTPP